MGGRPYTAKHIPHGCGTKKPKFKEESHNENSTQYFSFKHTQKLNS